MARTLLGRIARHGVTLARNPREDRLTEICAALFESPRCRGLARHVAQGWLAAAVLNPERNGAERIEQIQDLLADESAEWSCKVRTQLIVRTTEGLRRPDLELSFEQTAPSRTRRVLIWVEVKHGTKPHDDQLYWYLRLQPQRGITHALVVLVAPRDSYPGFDEGQVPSEVARLTWEETGRIVSDFRTTDLVGTFLVDELRRYLTEEGLVDPEQLTAKHLEAFANYGEALRALIRACEIAADHLKDRWAPGERYSWPDKGDAKLIYWSYPLSAHDETRIPAPEAWDLTWQLSFDSSQALVDCRQGVPVLMAGLSAKPGNLALLSTTVLERLDDAGLLAMSPPTQSIGWDYVVRLGYPDELHEVFEAGDLARQARALAQWVDSAFRDIAQALSGADPR